MVVLVFFLSSQPTAASVAASFAAAAAPAAAPRDGGSEDCPQGCLGGPWGEWASCVSPCNPLQQQQRSRTILLPAKNGGPPCVLQQQRSCRDSGAFDPNECRASEQQQLLQRIRPQHDCLLLLLSPPLLQSCFCCCGCCCTCCGCCCCCCSRGLPIERLV